jgi:probable HAF family extracellular repeat protein
MAALVLGATLGILNLTSAQSLTWLGTLSGHESGAYGVSADGSVIVGWATDANGFWRAFRWTEAEGMQELGTLGGSESGASGVSADGSIVVGEATDASGNSRAFRWTQVGGIEDLNQTYTSLLADGSELWDARAISPDGRYIVGRGYNAATGRLEAYLLDMGAPSLSRIRGNIALNDFVGDITQVPVEVELRGETTQTLTVYPETNGDYAISDVQPGTYDIAFKASHWLRVVVPGVEVSGTEVTGIDVALTNGDVDGDNEVTLFDFGQLVAAFGSMPGDSNWNADADLDGDEEVTLFDFGVLVRNFGAIGDE